jgi:hypothetical protein
VVCRRASRVLVDPLLWLSRSDEGQHGLGKDRPLVVEAGSLHGYVAVGQKMGFDNGLEGGFVPLCHSCAPSASPQEFLCNRSSRDILEL